MNLSCQCGKRFRNMADEGRHRHNFPAMCKKKKMPRPTKAQKKLLDSMVGQQLIKTFDNKLGTMYQLADGAPVHLTVAEGCIKKGLVKGQEDGLLPGVTQTWVLP